MSNKMFIIDLLTVINAVSMQSQDHRDQFHPNLTSVTVSLIITDPCVHDIYYNCTVQTNSREFSTLVLYLPLFLVQESAKAHAQVKDRQTYYSVFTHTCDMP